VEIKLWKTTGHVQDYPTVDDLIRDEILQEINYGNFRNTDVAARMMTVFMSECTTVCPVRINSSVSITSRAFGRGMRFGTN
jgi:hypothetical protein